MNDMGTNIHSNECKCFSWKPVIAGALAAIGFSFLLNLFGIAISLTAFTTDSRGVENLAFGGLIATCMGIVVSMFAAGWLAGYLGQRHCSKRHIGALYGFLTWCVALIVTIFLAQYIHNYIIFYTHFISGGTVSNAMAATSNMAMSASASPTKSVMISTYIVFSLFFLSAFACSLGGHAGMRHVCKDNC